MNRGCENLPSVGDLNRLSVWAFSLLLGCVSASAQTPAPQVVVLSAAADTSLFSEGDLSNGGGQYLFTGLTAIGAERRALLQFDLSPLPRGASIQSASLRLTMSRTISGTLTVRLHRLDSAWGEGGVAAPGQEGTGAAAAAGDATWQASAFPATAWINPGGDFRPQESARTGVRDNADYVWQSAQLANDVQQWLDGSAVNAGWIVIGNAAAGFGSAKRFNSREHPDPDSRPVLTVTYTGGAAMPAPAVGVPTLTSTGVLLLMTLVLAAAAWTLRLGRSK